MAPPHCPDRAGQGLCATYSAEQETARIMGVWFLGTWRFVLDTTCSALPDVQASDLGTALTLPSLTRRTARAISEFVKVIGASGS